MKNLILLFCCLGLSPFVWGQEKFPSPALVKQLMTVPNTVDKDQNGALTLEEILHAPQQLATLDKNGDGELDWKEMGAYEEMLPFVRNHNITNLIDDDGNVHISAEEIKNAPTALRALDLDGDWQISKKEMAFGQFPNMPVFSTRRMPMPVWKNFRGYTTKIAGNLPPGKDPRAAAGYMLIHDAGDTNFTHQGKGTYLLNEKGEKVHEWKHEGYSPEGTVAYLLPNGQLLRTINYHNWIKAKSFPVGSNSTIELIDWDSKVLWAFSMEVKGKYSFHHDVEYLPNGNILALRYDAFTKEEAMAMGWDASLGIKALNRIEKKGSGLVWMESLLELQPNLKDGSTEIVWQWNSWEHLVQNKFPNKLNYGDITNPSKIHINYLNLDTDVPYNAGQIFHCNAIDYHPELDMIMLSSATYGELWFIDHSTTMAEAAGDTDGKYNKGGDLLYRVGNDHTYGKGTRNQSTLFWQHDAHWIEEGLPGAGNILVYNNGSRRTLDDRYKKDIRGIGFGKSYSQILELQIPINQQGHFNRHQKAEVVWSWQEKNKADFYSPFMSGAQRLPNGNTIFCRAYDKHIFEVTPEGEKVLDFSLAGWGRLYRIYKYGLDYSGLEFKK